MRIKIDNSIKYLLFLLAFSVAIFTYLIPDIFWSIDNFQSISTQIPILGILTLAMLIPMITGGINLSIIATMNACSLIIAYLVTQNNTILFIIIACLLGIVASMIIGVFNGILIAKIRVSPILATLGTMTLINGINILMTNGSTISNFPNLILSINNESLFFIPIPMIIFILLSLFVWFILEKTTLGRSIYFVGNNEKATFYSGINTNRVIITVYVLSSILCCFAAILMMSKLNSAKASYGDSYLLISILATVLGGINPDGGKGKVIGVIVSLILLQIIESGLNIIGISSYITLILWGSLLIFFVFIQRDHNK